MVPLCQHTVCHRMPRPPAVVFKIIKTTAEILKIETRRALSETGRLAPTSSVETSYGPASCSGCTKAEVEGSQDQYKCIHSPVWPSGHY